jgi:hypothetical protein
MSSDVRRWAPGFQPIYAPVQRNQHVVLHEKSFLIRAARFQKRGGGVANPCPWVAGLVAETLLLP